MILARNPKFVARILGEALVKQDNREDKSLSSWVLCYIEEKIRVFQRSFTEQKRSEMFETQLAMLEESKTYDEFLDQLKSKNSTLHPKILIKKLSKYPLPEIKGLLASNNKPIVHQAVLLFQQIDEWGEHIWNVGNLSLDKLCYELNFDVNAPDKNGYTALHNLFRTYRADRIIDDERPERSNSERHIYFNFKCAGYNFDSLMEYLGKHLTLFGR